MYRLNTDIQIAMTEKAPFVHERLSYTIIGILYEVYNELGPGLKERTYQRAVAAGLKEAGLKFQEEVYIPVTFKSETVGSHYFDFLVEDQIVIELKVGDYFSRRNIDQVYRYLLAKNLLLGLLANFTRRGVKIKRVVNLPDR